MLMWASEIKFRHDIIPTHFVDGGTLRTLVFDIIEDLDLIFDMEPLLIKQIGSQTVCMKGNRRLYCLQYLESRGFINFKVPVEEFHGFKPITAIDGAPIEVEDHPNHDSWLDNEVYLFCRDRGYELPYYFDEYNEDEYDHDDIYDDY